MAFSDGVSQAGLALLHSFQGMKLEQQPSGHKSRKDHVPSLLRLDTVDSDDGEYRESEGFAGGKEEDGPVKEMGTIAEEKSDKGNVCNRAAELVSHTWTRTVPVV